MRRSVVLALLGTTSAKLPFGVCYTRNMVVGDDVSLNTTEVGKRLRNVILSATSLKKHHDDVPACLFTDAPPEIVRQAVTEVLATEKGLVGHEKFALFDAILEDGLVSFRPRNAKETALLKSKQFREKRLKVKSRIGRIANLARGPYELTLFADDDTFFCSSIRDTLTYLRKSHAFDVRGKVFAKRKAEEARLRDAQRCVWRKAETTPFSAIQHLKCLDKASTFCSGAQGGAFAIRSGPRAEVFARNFLDAYLHFYADLEERAEEKHRQQNASRSFGGDQAPLAGLMARNCAENATNWTFGALPSAVNVRDAERTKGRCVAPVFGPVVLLHHKRYVNAGNLSEATRRLTDLCAHTNRPHHLGGSVWTGRRSTHSGGGHHCPWMPPHAAGGAAGDDNRR